MGGHALLRGTALTALLALGLAAACEREGASQVPADSDQTIFFDPDQDFSDPAIATSAGGAAALVWRAFDGSGDGIQASLAQGSAWGAAQRISQEAQHHLPAQVTPDPRGGFLVVWPARVEGQYELFARRIGVGLSGEVQRITNSAANDIAPALLTGSDGRVWVAWQADHDGPSDVYASVLDAGAWAAPWQVTSHPSSDSEPALGEGPDGSPWIAWTTWRDGTYADGNYEVYAGRLESGGVEPGACVSTSRRTDMSPRFVPLQGGLALLWTESYFPSISVGDITAIRYDNWADKVYQVAWLEVDGFSAPQGVRLNVELSIGSVLSQQFAAVSGPQKSEVLLVYGDRLVRQAFDRTWVTKLCRIDRVAGVSGSLDLSADVDGPTQRYAAAGAEDHSWIVDTILSGSPAAPRSRRAQLRVRSVNHARLGTRQPALALKGPSRSPVDDSLRLDASHPVRSEVQFGAARWRSWFGNLHLHSDLSLDRLGFEGGVAENFQVVRDVAALDFAGISDHGEGLRAADWWDTRALVELWNRPGAFVTLPGYEWTSGTYGHKNVFFPSTDVAGAAQPFGAAGRTPTDLWEHLDERRALAIPHHIGFAAPQATDWSFRSDRFQRLVEIFQKRGSYEYDGAPNEDVNGRLLPGHSVRHALDEGHRLGIIASPDHGGGLGLAGVWASELTRDSLWEALHARRTFGTTGAKMDLFLTVAGAPLGSEVVAGGQRVYLTGRVHATATGLTLTLVRDGVELEHWREPGRTASIEWEGPAPVEGVSYFYLRATQSDGHMGWTSPVWVWPAGSSIPTD